MHYTANYKELIFTIRSLGLDVPKELIELCEIEILLIEQRMDEAKYGQKMLDEARRIRLECKDMIDKKMWEGFEERMGR